MKPLQLLLLFFVSFNANSQLTMVLQTGNKNDVNSLEFSKFKNHLLSTDDKSVVIWDLQQRKQYASIELNDHIISSGFINDSLLFISKTYEIEVWNYLNSTYVFSIKSDVIIHNTKVVNSNICLLSDHLYIYKIKNDSATIQSEIEINNSSDFYTSSTGKYLGFVKQNQYLLYSTELNKTIAEIKTKDVTSSHINETLNILSIASNPSAIHNYTFTNTFIKKNSVISNSRKWNNYNSLYLNDSIGISGDQNDIITLYNLKSGKILKRFKNKSGIVTEITSNKNQTIYAISGKDGIINLFDQSFEKFHTFKPISAIPSCIRMLDDNETVLIGYNNGEIKKWNLSTHNINTLYPENNKQLFNHKNYRIITLNEQENIVEKKWKTAIKNIDKSKQYYIAFDSVKNEYKINKKLPLKYQKDKSNVNSIHLPKGEAIQFISDFKYGDNYFVGSSSGFIYLVNPKGTILLKMVSPNENTFFYATPDNYYFSSKSALKHIGARYKQDLIGFEQIDLIYNRPDKIIPIITPNTSQAHIDLLTKAYHKRLKKLNILSTDIENFLILPTLQCSLSELPLNSEKSTISINVKATSKTNKLKALHILINDTPIYGKSGFKISGLMYESKIDIELSNGENNIQIFIENEYGTKSLREKTSINCNYAYKPNLHILSIGSGKFIDEDYNLKYASKDAEDIRKLFDNTKQFNTINSTILTEEKVTLINIEKAINQLKEVNINDVIIVFFAGHGVLDKNLDYYLSSYEMDFENPNSNGINFEELEQKLSQLKCRNKLLLIDACHSGEIDKEEVKEIENDSKGENEEFLVFRSGQSSIGLIGGVSAFELSKNIFVDLRSNSGVITISSAGAAEYALEGDKWQNGAFTYCILKGIIEKKADTNKDKKITTNELQKYLFDEVPKLTNGMQTPTSRVELLEQNFIVW